MNPSDWTVKQDFFSWVDRSLSQSIPEATVAYHFNLYEGTDSVHVQLVGTETFIPGNDPEKDYWPGAETFTTGEDIFEIPFTVAGSDWQEWLSTSKEMLHAYISSGVQSSVLRASKGVGLGFVDGDMYILWQSAN